MDKELSKYDTEYLEKIEDAYSSLMAAYFSCLANININTIKYRAYLTNPVNYIRTPLYFWNDLFCSLSLILAPRITRWKIKRSLYMFQEMFLLLIAKSRITNNPEITKPFELYCEDMNKLTDQVAKSGLTALIYGSIPAGLLSIIISLDTLNKTGFISQYFINSLLGQIITAFYLIFYIFWIIILGFWSSKSMFEDSHIPEEERKVLDLIRDYLKFDHACPTEVSAGSEVPNFYINWTLSRLLSAFSGLIIVFVSLGGWKISVADIYSRQLLERLMILLSETCISIIAITLLLLSLKPITASNYINLILKDSLNDRSYMSLIIYLLLLCIFMFVIEKSYLHFPK